LPTSPELSVSNIAFPADQFDTATVLLRRLGIDAVEIAPYNVFGRWDVSAADIAAFHQNLVERGMHCPALQGIVYNAGAAHLFSSAEAREALYLHLVGVARMAGLLGAKACVFGAPKLRDPGTLPEADARAIAVDFFRRIGPVFASEGATLAFEPNARHYACRFIVTTEDAMNFLDDIDSSGIGLQIDTGTVFLERENPEVLVRAARYAAHAHVSEPDLAPLGTAGVDHRPVADAFRRSGYGGSLSIEMRTVSDWQGAIEKAVSLTRETYLQ
jgi:sugar phosphate isomerase/epimerase